MTFIIRDENSPIVTPPNAASGKWDVHTDMQSNYDPVQKAAPVQPAVAQFFNDTFVRANNYDGQPADGMLDVYGRERAWDYEKLVGVRPQDEPFTAIEPYLWVDDATGDDLWFSWKDSQGNVTQMVPDFTIPACSDILLTDFLLSRAKGYRGYWLDNVDFIRPNNGWSFTLADGVTDAVPRDKDTGTAMTPAKWNMILADWIIYAAGTLRAAGAQVCINPLWWCPWSADLERAHAFVDYINIEGVLFDTATTAGTGTYGFETLMTHIDLVHGLGTNIVFDTKQNPLTEGEFDYARAFYLLMKKEGDLFGVDDRTRTVPAYIDVDTQVSVPASFDARLNDDLGWSTGLRQVVPDAGGDYWIRNFTNGKVTVKGPPDFEGTIEIF